jgi:MHS family proline/betaine transporter-like MFS transporter
MGQKQNYALILSASTIGYIVEVYDFVVYGFLAVILAKVLFPPAGDPMLPLLSALLVFGIGFLFRPLGGFIFAHIGDKYGRKIAFIITLLLMGIACLGMGLLPTYAEVGILATILLVLFRILQGISVGGESGTGIAFIQEHSPTHRRGLFTSIVAGAWTIGPLLSILTIYIFTVTVGPAALEAWGWRVAFLVGVALVGIGLIIRFFVEETPVFKQLKSRGEVLKNPIVVSFRRVWKQMLKITLALGALGTVYYVNTVTIWSVFWLTIAEVPLLIAAPINIFIFTVGYICGVIAGYLADKYGRRPIVIWGYLLYLIIAVPLFSVFVITKDIFTLTVAALIIGIIGTFPTIALYIMLPELAPANVRLSVYNVGYQLSAGFIIGFAPFVMTWLWITTGNILWALTWPAAFAVLGIILTWLWLPETKGIDISKTLAIEVRITK